jgi:ferredoxin
MEYRVTKGCTFCMTCVYECPTDAIEMTSEGARIDQVRCVACGTCYENCASEAIEAVKNEGVSDA